MRTGEEFSSYTVSTHNKNNNSSCSLEESLQKSQDSIMNNELSSFSLSVSSSPSLLLSSTTLSTTSTTTTSSSSSTHSRDSDASSSSAVLSSCPSAHSLGARRVAFDHVDIIELAVELGDHPYCTTGPAVQTSGFVERRVVVDLQDFESQRSPLRRSAPQLYLSSEDRMKLLHLDVSLPIQESLIPSTLLTSTASSSLSLSSSSSSSSWSSKNYHATEERMLEMDKRVDSLLQRMEVLDESMARMGRRRQQRQRARRAALVVSRTNRHHSAPSCCGLESS